MSCLENVFKLLCNISICCFGQFDLGPHSQFQSPTCARTHARTILLALFSFIHSISFCLADLVKINARYISTSRYTTSDANCMGFRKGDCGVLLEVNKDGWWRMSIDGVEGWTPGNYWEYYEVCLV